MARARSRLSNGVLLLDCQGLSRFIENDPRVVSLVRAAQAKDTLVAVSNLTLIEAWHSKVQMARFRWHVARLEVLPVTEAIVAATALDYAGPRIVVTSDTDGMNKLCGDRVRAVGV
ncbi:DNA-binding protein [Streptomyces sp. NPDC051322]|uniref:DNA-binding protein n=1 Tax=Streptomyces sp. NPDC051322 TaxID=3154645 RepID=UPI00344B4423